jgi:hypothetical protein
MENPRGIRQPAMALGWDQSNISRLGAWWLP